MARVNEGYTVFCHPQVYPQIEYEASCL